METLLERMNTSCQTDQKRYVEDFHIEDGKMKLKRGKGCWRTDGEYNLCNSCREALSTNTVSLSEAYRVIHKVIYPQEGDQYIDHSTGQKYIYHDCNWKIQ